MTTEELDLATWPIFHSMTRRGLLVDVGRMDALRADVVAGIDEQVALIESILDEPINPASGDEVAKYMAGMGYRGKKTPGGNRLATDERSLAAHPGDPVLDAVLAHRGLSKMLNTFIDPVLEKARTPPHTIHPRWRLTKVRSGRVATEDPNLLAFPSRDDMGRKVRSCFVARPGKKMLSVDFSQLEPRIVAALSQDPKLVAVYTEGRDLYTEIAKDIGISRQAAKTLTLGILYGMGAQRLYEQLQLPPNPCLVGDPPVPMYDLDACEAMIERWFKTYSGVKRLVDETISRAKRDGGWARTVGGRGRLLPGLFLPGAGWPNEKLREEAERQAFNHLVQGTGMEKLREAMLVVHDDILRRPDLLLAIHDELVMEIDESIAEAAAPHIAEFMESSFHGVRLKTSHCLGDDWGSLKN